MSSNIPLHYNGKQPYGSNQCGAYALTACLLALDKVPKPKNPIDLEYQLPGLPWSRSARVPPSQVDPATSMDPCAANIYTITGLCNPVTLAYEQYTTVGVNPVSALAWVAQEMGCKVSVWVNNIAYNNLSALYPLEQAMIHAVLGTDPIISNGEPELNNNEVQLMLVQGGGHWVARGSNYYDPATGSMTTDMPGGYVSSQCHITLSQAG